MRADIASALKSTGGRLIPSMPVFQMLADRPDDPDALMHLWDWFQDMSMMRQSTGMGGIAPLTWADLFYWQRVTGVRLNGWERDVMQRLDRTFRSVMSEKSKPDEE